MLLFLLFGCADPPPAKTPPPVVVVDSDGDGSPDTADCAPDDPYVAPGRDEIPYDGRDQDCDGEDVIDYDGDGYIGDSIGGDDCNDNNPEVNPGAVEVCYNALDDDCVGDDGGSDDCDKDGYDRGVDCEDEDPSINPGVEDVPYDGLDANCDGASDDDLDADGHTAEIVGGDDCDDTNAEIYPFAQEIWDHADSNCDGNIDPLDLDSANAVWRADFANGEGLVGYAIAPVGDLDGNGTPEVSFGVPGNQTDAGRVWLVEVVPGIQSAPSAFVAQIEGAAGETLGLGLAHVGDYLFVQSSSEVLAFATADLRGGAVLGAGDAAGSIGTPSPVRTLGAGPTGSTLVAGSAGRCPADCFMGVFPASAGSFDDGDAELLVRGASADTPTAMHAVGDADGDGISDLIASFSTGAGASAVVMVTGDQRGDLRRVDLPGLTGTGRFTAVSADLDADGLAELILADDADATGADRAGRLFLLNHGDFGGDTPIGDVSYATWTPSLSDWGLTVVGVTDLDGDAADEILVCGPGSREAEAEPVEGECRAVVPDTGSLGTQASPIWFGETDSAFFGHSAVLDDTEGDGDLDLWIGAPAQYGDVYWYRQD